ncbi:MAG TPA: ATP-binding protein [Herpetosiphonaceae bacterium]|nr:ATP-binding protein [Herpetosiphonaceae bacterium]
MSEGPNNAERVTATEVDTTYLPSVVLDALPSHIAVLDRAGTIIAVNAAWNTFARANGDPTLRSTGTGVNYFDVCRRATGSEAARALAGIEGVLDGTLPRFSLEYPCHSPGEQRWFLLDATPLDVPGAGAVVVHTNITEHKRAEAERAGYTARLRDLAAASLHINAALSMEAVLQATTDQARAIIGAHQAATSFSVEQSGPRWISTVSLSDKYAASRDGWARPEGEALSALVCRDNRPMRLTQGQLEAQPAYDNPGSEAGKYPAPRGWMAAPLVGRDGGNLGLIQLSDKYRGDFTEADESTLVQLAQLASVAVENARLYDEAQRALQVRNEFLSMVAHELKTPLTTVLGNAELLRRRLMRDGSVNARSERALEVMVAQARRLNKMIGDLLNLSRLETGQLRLELVPFDLGALIARVLSEVEPGLRNHALVYRGVDAPVIAVGDELRIEQVLQNLIQNAIKYSPDGGTITVTLEQDARQACFAVSDEGIGIPKAELPQLFHRYFRAGNASARQISGVGVGLYVVHEILERHNGTIEVQSVEGKGSMFTVCLPREQPSQDSNQ